MSTPPLWRLDLQGDGQGRRPRFSGDKSRGAAAFHQVMMDKTQTGRHRRARFAWWRWRPQLHLELGAIGVEVTVEELQRRQERERAYASQARRVLVMPRQRSTDSANR